MKEFLSQIAQWQKDKKMVVLARVIQTWGSSPRPVSSCMLISSAMEIAGSVSGGCVEGAVLKESKAVIENLQGKRLFYGVSDDDAWSVGLSCGGKIQVYLQPWIGLNKDDPATIELTNRLKANQGSVLVTRLVDGPTENTLVTSDGKFFGATLPSTIIEQAKNAYGKRAHEVFSETGLDYFIHVFPPRSKIIIVGAAHITADLVQLGKSFDFETIVIDPRNIFADNTSFPVPPDLLFKNYPSAVLDKIQLDPYTYVVILSHDPKIDDDALRVLLRTQVAYIGALGSKKNHEKRTARLLGHGFSMEEIGKINAPIGMDIHALGAREIALSIMGAIIKAKNSFLRN